MNTTIVACFAILAVSVLLVTALSLRFVGKFFGELDDEDTDAIERRRAQLIHERDELQAHAVRRGQRWALDHLTRFDAIGRELSKLPPPRKPKGETP
jgi:hypothetical protein